MKTKLITGIAVVALLAGALSLSVFAQNAGGNCGRGKCMGYGGPPQSQEERAVRQASCLAQNGGVCPSGGPKTNCPAGGCRGQGKAFGKGLGQGHQSGKQAGVCQRGAATNCPALK